VIVTTNSLFQGKDFFWKQDETSSEQGFLTYWTLEREINYLHPTASYLGEEMYQTGASFLWNLITTIELHTTCVRSRAERWRSTSIISAVNTACITRPHCYINYHLRLIPRYGFSEKLGTISPPIVHCFECNPSPVEQSKHDSHMPVTRDHG